MANIGLDYRAMSLDQVTHAYIQHLIKVASGHTSDDGKHDLVEARYRKEMLDGDILEFKKAELQGTYVKVFDTEKAYEQLVDATKAEFIACGEKIKTTVFTIYGIDIDIEYLNEPIESALTNLTKLGVSISNDGESAIPAIQDSREVDDNGMGEKVSGNKRKVKRNTRKVPAWDYPLDYRDARSARWSKCV